MFCFVVCYSSHPDRTGALPESDRAQPDKTHAKWSRRRVRRLGRDTDSPMFYAAKNGNVRTVRISALVMGALVLYSLLPPF